MAIKSVRELALKLLMQVGESGGFSHILINQAISNNDVSEKDKGLLTELVYGTLQRRLTLEFYLKPFVKKKMDQWVKWLLYLSIYQMVYLDKIPDHAVINEAVSISKRNGHRGKSGFVNGVLRNVQRKGVPSFSSINDPIEELSIRTSHPYWLVNRWVKMYGMDTTEEMCESNLKPKKISARIQPLKINMDEAQSTLKQEDIETEQSSLSKQGVNVLSGNVLSSSLFPEKLTIQDETSMLVSEMIDVESGMTVLDACSAPGGKTTHIAEKMHNQGTIYAYDLHDKKVKLVKEKAETLDLTIIQTGTLDSRLLGEKHNEESFDRILIDAPCTGLGVLRSKPDIKYHKKESDIYDLAQIQRQLLEAVIPLLKQDGRIVYSTCTVDVEENENQIKQFLNDFPDFEVDPSFFKQLPDSCRQLNGISDYGIQLFPQDFNADGFFITRLKRK
ncbi:16S rRNA (cytosine(967)-C(5))-methyltransferase RsmB [Tenuibacillus multivorans]|uniref:16S rRNA (cytosine(967)-C(5))-methyltransferase n=1 Tax=Tenuibacillus multivorans TaxID=237069 RepID=A0A1G9Y485_9BACI|nr:16S rRNA (cytosine(967)-C(5))-methyltransferase RsmB [Tenuibacillus multivorans]GEL75926.1 ribosomal RNA small subunit methyltransferase B [Tenuibacillus multivorans]SDN03381.1 16S rRNA (cytosine967-C5)-methyltransferase [Tenuibacillus multivorans]